jgi:hypothetical protein
MNVEAIKPLFDTLERHECVVRVCWDYVNEFEEVNKRGQLSCPGELEGGWPLKSPATMSIESK